MHGQQNVKTTLLTRINELLPSVFAYIVRFDENLYKKAIHDAPDYL